MVETECNEPNKETTVHTADIILQYHPDNTVLYNVFDAFFSSIDTKISTDSSRGQILNLGSQKFLGIEK